VKSKNQSNIDNTFQFIKPVKKHPESIRTVATIQSFNTSFHPDIVRSKFIDRIGFSSDASFYRLIPNVVLQPKTEWDIQDIFHLARQLQKSVVFRAAGTSLSGQSITDGILVDIGRHWRKHYINDYGKSIRLQPGVIGGHANKYLARHQRKLGPDPASMDVCMIGGIVANNASGMRCGVHRNAYHTLESIRFILPNGHIYDSSEAEAPKQFARSEPDLADAIKTIRHEISANREFSSMIREKYHIKNTTGYSLNAFLDYTDQFDIFCHLLVGSEGTLAFISSVTLRTLPDPRWKATALVVFPSMEKAMQMVQPLRDIGAEAVEFMDKAALYSVENQLTGIPGISFNTRTISALLIEVQENKAPLLEEKIQDIKDLVTQSGATNFTGFYQDEAIQQQLWKIRKGLYPAVSGERNSGTSVIIEDIAFRLPDLPAATSKLRRILNRHGYKDGIIFGHAKDGNLHFVITQQFDEEGIERYSRLMDDIVSLVVEEFGGSLKAEHGTGRNMAPFVQKEWGDALYDKMQRLKNAADPKGILNPDVIVSNNPKIHLQNIKHLPQVAPEIDQCMECGFCELVCPSKDLTTTPRRRIVILREIIRLSQENSEEQRQAELLRRQYQYEGVDTCAADGMCALACPVDINTGEMMKTLRAENRSFRSRLFAEWCMNHFGLVTNSIRTGLSFLKQMRSLIGTKWLRSVVSIASKVTKGLLPGWNNYLPEGYKPLFGKAFNHAENTELVYFPSCLTRTAGSIPGESGKYHVSEAFEQVLDRAGIRYNIPENLSNLCCGMPWNSKGFPEIYRKMAEKVVENLWRSSNQGDLPIVVDTSPCTYTMMHYDEILRDEHLEQWQILHFVDIVEYLDSRVLPKLAVKKQPGKVVCHPTCSTEKMNQSQMLLHIARSCSEEVVLPESHGCCGFAGDRGLMHPELTASATGLQAEEITMIGGNLKGHYSTSRTCEMAMSNATDRVYSSIIQLVEKASRPE